MNNPAFWLSVFAMVLAGALAIERWARRRESREMDFSFKQKLTDITVAHRDELIQATRALEQQRLEERLQYMDREIARLHSEASKMNGQLQTRLGRMELDFGQQIRELFTLSGRRRSDDVKPS